MPSQPPPEAHSRSTMQGPGAPVSSPDPEDDAVTRVGKLPPDFQRSQEPPPARAAHPPQPVPVAPAQPRKVGRRRTLSRGEPSPLPQGRRPTHDGREAREPRAAHGHAHSSQAGQPHAEPRHAPHDGRPHAHDSRKHAAHDAPAPRGGATPLRSVQLPSEVPTAPGNDARAGAARAAALRALSVADDEVTAQRDVAVLHRLRDLKDLAVDDLDEDTSVLPDIKIKDATDAAIATKKAADEARAMAAAAEDDRPTPADADAELLTTLPLATGQTAVMAPEAVPASAVAPDPARSSAIDSAWVTSDARSEPAPRGRSLTVQNPAAIAEAAAADAAVAAAHAAQAAKVASQATRPAARPSQPVAEKAALSAPSPAAATPAPAYPVCAFRVAIFPPDRPGSSPRIIALAPGSALPAGATGGVLVATTDAESADLARLFGYTK